MCALHGAIGLQLIWKKKGLGLWMVPLLMGLLLSLDVIV